MHTVGRGGLDLLVLTALLALGSLVLQRLGWVEQGLPLLALALLLVFALRRWWEVIQLQQGAALALKQVEQQMANLRKETEALRQSEAFYQTVLDDIPEMICRWRPDGRISYVNQAYCHYFDFSRERLRDEGWLPMILQGDEASSERSQPSLYREQPVAVVEFPVLQSGGSQRWQRWVDRALFDDQGRIREFQSIGEDVTERKQREQESRRLLEEIQGLARQTIAIQEEERARLARELHDELGQSLTAIRADAETILLLGQGGDPRLMECAAAINEVAGQVYDTVRLMMQQLRPLVLDELGLTEAVRELLRGWNHRHPEVRVTSRLEKVGTLSAEVRLAAYRIVQEALTNVARHSGASQMELWLREDDSHWLELTVLDNGCGLPNFKLEHGHGLLGMRERCLALGGDFQLNGSPGAGVKIVARLPC